MRPRVETLDRLSPEEVRRLDGLGLFGGGSRVTRRKTPRRHKKYDPYSYSETGYASSYDADGYPWDMWATAYRMLGGFIDCDWQQGGDNMYDQQGNYRNRRKRRRTESMATTNATGHANRNLNNNADDDNANDDDAYGQNACGRWMMWAAYANPNYQGNGYYEYFDDDGVRTGSLDCHEADTEWQLIGVYRQEFYQFLEQIAKHLWAIDEYEYAVAWGGLEYMTEDDCFQLYPNDDDGTYYYAGVLPSDGGTFQMSLFEDAGCRIPKTDTEFSSVYEDQYYYNSYWSQFDDDEYVYQNQKGRERRRLDEDKDDVCNGDDGRRLGDNDGDGYMDCQAWASAREPTLEAVNSVFETYKYCSPCIDYPSYQDGYLIGDDGTDEDDLINQCWKFHSHDSYPCTGECLLKGSFQGSITEVQVGGQVFGSWEGGGRMYRHGTRIKANMYLTLSAILFTSILLHILRKRERRVIGSKSRTLLTADERQRARSPRNDNDLISARLFVRCRPVCCDTSRLLRPLLRKNRPKSPERYMIGDLNVPSSGPEAPMQSNIRSLGPSPGRPRSPMFDDRQGANNRALAFRHYPARVDLPMQKSARQRPDVPQPRFDRSRTPTKSYPGRSRSETPHIDRSRTPSRDQRPYNDRSRSGSPLVYGREGQFSQLNHPHRPLGQTRHPQMSLQHALDKPTRGVAPHNQRSSANSAPPYRSRSSSPQIWRSNGHGSIRVLNQAPPTERHTCMSAGRPGRVSGTTSTFNDGGDGGTKSKPKTKSQWQEEFKRQKKLTVPNKPVRRSSFRSAGERLMRKSTGKR